MIFIAVIVFVDVGLLGILAIYEGGRTEATLFVNKENPSDETGVSSSAEIPYFLEQSPPLNRG